ncbi:predicted protein [Streptomyces lividans TK24]|uniref:Uncharacterized protein n=1 Tax=Streptomyces lividans 1326 TaxID=1200984 RepID=A0A7U9HBS8_STRLI|nr:predicted protein [Streptomyces lividans TK24]EOY48928.1 hypothetical protein SLI_4217 [Streptomyces lividans 1326]
MAGGGQSWRAHHRTHGPHAVRQVRKVPYDRKAETGTEGHILFRAASHTPVGGGDASAR